MDYSPIPQTVFSKDPKNTFTLSITASWSLIFNRNLSYRKVRDGGKDDAILYFNDTVLRVKIFAQECKKG